MIDDAHVAEHIAGEIRLVRLFLGEHLAQQSVKAPVHRAHGIDRVDHLNDGDPSAESRWTSYNGDNVLINPWVQYAFGTDVTIWGCNV